MAHEHKLMTFEQVAYHPPTDRATTFADGLDYQSSEGWTLVTSFPSQGYAPGATTLFVFMRNARRRCQEGDPARVGLSHMNATKRFTGCADLARSEASNMLPYLLLEAMGPTGQVAPNADGTFTVTATWAPTSRKTK